MFGSNYPDYMRNAGFEVEEIVPTELIGAEKSGTLQITKRRDSIYRQEGQIITWLSFWTRFHHPRIRNTLILIRTRL